MNNNEFIYWLRGYFELCRVEGEVKLTQEQILCIEDHLKLCFDKITPERNDGIKTCFEYNNDWETHPSC